MGTKKKSMVSAELRLLGSLVFHARPFWAAAGRLESSFYRDVLDQADIHRPIFVAGLARSGTTVLLEMLHAHPDTASLAYKDFPMLYTPCWWNRFIRLAGCGTATLEERAHKDGIRVGPDSPEAMEEPLWMHFFDHLHNPAACNVLAGQTDVPQFETFYRDHIRKVLTIRGGSRYLAKGNYNLARIEYLLRLFPDARFIIPFRDPVSHIASLRKQQRLFEKLERDDPPVLQHMCRVGHFEFGLNWTPVNYGRQSVTDQILEAWRDGRDVEAWALYWEDTHRYLLSRLQSNAALRDAVLIVNYESLCADSKTRVPSVFKHCGLVPNEDLVAEWSGRLKLPSYYAPDFSEQEMGIIREHTAGAFERLISL
jgi:hypothetical protein